MSYYVNIVEYSTGTIVDRIGPSSSEREAERVERGVNINLNHADYYTEVVNSLPPLPDDFDPADAQRKGY